MWKRLVGILNLVLFISSIFGVLVSMVFLIGSLINVTFSIFPNSILKFPTTWLVITGCGALVSAMIMKRRVERVIPAGTINKWKGNLLVVVILVGAAALFCLFLYLSFLIVQMKLFIPVAIVFSIPDIAIIAWVLARRRNRSEVRVGSPVVGLNWKLRLIIGGCIISAIGVGLLIKDGVEALLLGLLFVGIAMLVVGLVWRPKEKPAAFQPKRDQINPDARRLAAPGRASACIRPYSGPARAAWRPTRAPRGGRGSRPRHSTPRGGPPRPPRARRGRRRPCPQRAGRNATPTNFSIPHGDAWCEVLPFVWGIVW